MRLSPLHASLLTLALFAAGPAHAAATAPEPLQLAQAETDAPADFDVVTKFLAGTQDVSRLDEDELQQRLKRALKLRETEGLPLELDQALQQRIAELESEIARRSEAAQQAPAPEPEQQAEQPAPEPQPEAQQQVEQPAPEAQPEPQQEPAQVQAEQPAPEPEQPAPQEQAGGNDGGSPEVAQFLASVRPAAELSEDELRQQMQRATELAKTPDIAPDQRKALRDVIREARTALRNKAGEPAQAEQQPEAAPQPEPEQPATEQATQQPAPAEQPQAKPETPAEKQIAQPPEVDPALEQQARAILEDKTDASTLNRRELRQRLGTIRDLLATNQLSVETREALRAKLAAERQVLRRDVAVEEGAPAPAQQPQQPQQGGSGSSTTANTTIINNTNISTTNTDVRVVLKDRRPADELADDELVRRIDVYRDVVNDDQYDEEERIYWRRQMERDRRYLRSRMIEERRQRAAELRSGDFAFNVRIEDDYEPGRDVPDDVFAAEVDDEEITGVLVAPPRREIKRQYSVEEIERSPEARNAVARIEIDTVHFGFGEGFLREEEIDKLDRIAQVLEKILARHPDEVFLLEGHTDAVGSEASNLKLSRQRAQAVKEALTTYYVIPAENLKTVGLGERYLKIPTLAPEAENRRVSLARITPLVGRAD